jgi:hypothetical protein
MNEYFLQQKFGAIRSHRKLQTLIASSATTSFKASITTTSTISSTPSDHPLSNPIKFLNRLDMDTANAFKNEVLHKSNMSDHVNPKNLINITVDELRALNGPGENNGKLSHPHECRTNFLHCRPFLPRVAHLQHHKSTNTLSVCLIPSWHQCTLRRIQVA